MLMVVIHFNIQTTNGVDDATMQKMAGMMKQVALYRIKDQSTRPTGMPEALILKSLLFN